ncbi:hypothetical protein DFH06DRAFT_1305949 [Mycena polygramma]|nr:hypothetical protein DFH06DRAFT_1305949 [Mycena polygramma]
MQNLHSERMEAAQTVLPITPTYSWLPIEPPSSKVTPKGSLSEEEKGKRDKFWRKVAKLTTRYHDRERKWIGGSEIREWNRKNKIACQKCVNSRAVKKCVIDEDRPTCRPCRIAKIGCDRKPQFVYEMTKDEFYVRYADFKAVFDNPEPGRLRRYERITPLKKRRHPAVQRQRALQSANQAPQPASGNLDRRTALDKIRHLLVNEIAPLLIDVGKEGREKSGTCEAGWEEEELADCVKHIQSVEYNLRASAGSFVSH